MDNNFLQDILRRTGINLDLSSMFGGQPADNTQQVPNLQLPNPNVSGAPPSSVADQATMIKNILMKRFAPSAAAAPAPVQTPIELRKTDFGAQVPGRQPLRTAVMNEPINATAHSGSGIAAGFGNFLQALNNLNAKNEEIAGQDQSAQQKLAEQKDMYQWQKEFDINANEQNPQTIFDRDRRETELDMKQQDLDRKIQMDELRQQAIMARMGGRSGKHSAAGSSASQLYDDSSVALVDTKAKEDVAAGKYKNYNDAYTANAYQFAANLNAKVGEKQFVVRGLLAKIGDPKAVAKFDEDTIKVNRNRIDKLKDMKLKATQDFADQEAIDNIDKEINDLKLTNHDLIEQREKRVGSSNAEKLVESGSNATAPTATPKPTQPATIPAPPPAQAPANNGITFTGETDPKLGRRIIDANGRKGWMK